MQRASVMIVAESPFQLTLMADLLEANDMMTVRERSLEQAGRALAGSPLTMVIVDLDLADGAPQGVERLRKEAKRHDIPLLVVTDKGQRQVAEQVLKGCETGTVERPIDTSAFPRKVVAEIRRHTTRTRPAQA